MAEISPLRRRMIEDVTVRNLSPATQRSYLAAVKPVFWSVSDRLGLEDIRAFHVHLVAASSRARGSDQSPVAGPERDCARRP
jgi:integrase/recombinase XerD